MAVLSLLLARGWWAVLVIVAVAVSCAVGFRYPHPSVLSFVAAVAALGGFRASVELAAVRPRRGDGSDPGHLGRALLAPAWFWVLLSAGVNIMSCVLTAALLAGAVTPPWIA